MVRAYHAVFTAYGFWLPNDPRGSWSDFVRSWELFRAGLSSQDDRPLPSPWARSCWKVFLNTPGEIRRAVRYVEANPVKEGKRRQRWSFVRPFES